MRAKPGTEVTEREMEFLRLICEGKRIKQVAATMKVSRSTASNYATNIRIRVGLDNTYQVGIWALQNGYAPPVKAKHQHVPVYVRDASIGLVSTPATSFDGQVLIERVNA